MHATPTDLLSLCFNVCAGDYDSWAPLWKRGAELQRQARTPRCGWVIDWTQDTLDVAAALGFSRDTFAQYPEEFWRLCAVIEQGRYELEQHLTGERRPTIPMVWLHLCCAGVEIYRLPVEDRDHFALDCETFSIEGPTYGPVLTLTPSRVDHLPYNAEAPTEIRTLRDLDSWVARHRVFESRQAA